MIRNKMKAFVCSDLHYDCWKRYYPTAKDFVNGTNDRPAMLADADVLLCAGDLSNCYSDWCELVVALSFKYKKVVLVPGNHDLCVDWGDRAIFKTSERKLECYKHFLKSYPNVHLLDGDCITINGKKIAGCMGFWDTSFLEKQLPNEKHEADHRWDLTFDALHWNYFYNNLNVIKQVENTKLENALSKKPDIMMTHFCPLLPIDALKEMYRRSFYSTYFYFDKAKTKNVPLWIAGHTHSKFMNGRIMVNPLGYIEENQNIAFYPNLDMLFDSKKDDCFIEL